MTDRKKVEFLTRQQHVKSGKENSHRNEIKNFPSRDDTKQKKRKRKTIHVKLFISLSTIYAISDIFHLRYFLLKQEEKETTQNK